MYYTNVLQFLEERAQQYPDRIAFADPNASITFGELASRAQLIGLQLAKNVPPGAPVAFYMEKCVPAVCAMFGAVYAGGFYSFIDVRQPAARAQKALSVLEPAVLITDNANQEKIPELAFEGKVLHIEDLMALNEIRMEAADALLLNEISTETTETTLQDEIRTSDTLPAPLKEIRTKVTDTAPLYVNFTSGSTGTPKGVAVSHRSVIEFISHFAPLFGIDASDVIANQAPFDFDVSVKDIYSGLFSGSRVQLIPREYFSAPTVLMDYLCDQHVTTLIWAVSAMCFVSIMNGLQYRVPDSVRRVMFSGEVMPVKQLKVWQQYLPDAQYVNLYGPTEITCNCTYYILPKDKEFSLKDIIPAGIPFPNEKVFLLDENDSLVTPGMPDRDGEICVGGTCLALGYYRNPEKTAEAFVRNPLCDAWPETIYRTGDIGRYDGEGNLVYVSRKDFQIKHMGHRIELGEIEACAMAADGVSRACCLYDSAKKRLLLFFTGTIDKKELSEQMRASLPPFMVPNKITQLEEMPLNKNGKIDRNALRQL